ncbi:efflux RND transporter periplasmic adaptor subunit [Caldanaerobius polysaccharolyticus]|uniref:efflux RND transporter periplasmic adaptor subunit n=1 Tax=Caldanaerobius polysaccharolyticus TaxID=44256 RepID=UPI00047B47DA|nr:efflux RND transporter periplasmic adaptor subunit [Caldanaerobius polysaccharolyticus]
MKRFYLGLLLIFSVLIFSACSGEKQSNRIYTGTIEATEVNIQSEIAGRITDVYVKEGDEVKKGEKIAQLDVKQYQEQAKAAKAALDIAQLKYDRVKNTNGAELDAAKLNLEQAQAAYSLANLAVEKGIITAPMDGTITGVYLNRGEVVASGGIVAQLSDLGDLWVKIYVPEKELYKVSLNEKVYVKVDFLKGYVTGKVIFISPEGEFTPKNAVTRSSKEDVVHEVKVQIMDHIKDLKPGMLADVRI